MGRALGLVLTSGLPVLAQSTVLVSVDSIAAQANGPSYSPVLSENGRWIAFSSDASNLVVGDTNGQRDTFLRDVLAGTTERVSVSSGGAEGNSWSNAGLSLSADGRFVAFTSNASNLVAADTNGFTDVFVRDRLVGTTNRVSVSSAGAEASGPSFLPSISRDGRYVAFVSSAINLPAGTPGGYTRVYIHDNQTGQTQHVPFATFSSNAQQTNPRLSADGRLVAFEELLGQSQVYLHDVLSNTAEMISIAGGQPGNGSSGVADVSPDGRYVVFWSAAPNLVLGDQNGSVDVFVRDRQAAGTSRVSVSSTGAESNADSSGGAISDDGRYVTFSSSASNLVPGDNNGQPGQPWTGSDVFLRDRLTGSTTLLSLDTNGTQGKSDSGDPSMSSDARYIAFSSAASNLVANDTNSDEDVFLRDRGIPPPTTYCTAKINSLGCTPTIGWSGSPSLSGPDNFHVTATNVLNRKLGIMIWSGARASVPLYGGTRCVASPIIRTPGQNSGGNPPPTDCSGTYSFHFTQSYMSSHVLQVGSTVCAQFWSRDPGFSVPNAIGLTNGLEFVIAP